MKTYYYFDMELNLIDIAEFETEAEAEAFDHCFSDDRICCWNDKPYIEI